MLSHTLDMTVTSSDIGILMWAAFAHAGLCLVRKEIDKEDFLPPRTALVLSHLF